MRLTPLGQAVAGGGLVLGVSGWSLGYRELLLVATAGLLALVVALAWTWWQPTITLERTVLPPRVVRGEAAEARLTVTNPGRWPIPPLRAQDVVGERPVATTLPRTPAGATHRTTFALPTDRRGVVPVGPLRVIRQDPLGLAQRGRAFGNVETLWVYPRVHRVAPLSSGTRRDLEGPTHDGASGSITFHALREYVTGDDLRLIHWRSSARTGTLMVRQQADPSQPQTTIVLDTRRGSYEGDGFEHAVEAAASLVVASTSRRFPVRLLTGVGVLSTGRGGSGRSAGSPSAAGLLEHLTPLEPTEEGSLGDAANRLVSQPGGNSLVIVTGRPDPVDLRALERLSHRYVTMAFVRFLPDETPGVAWDRGLVDVRAPDAETFAILWNDKT